MNRTPFDPQALAAEIIALMVQRYPSTAPATWTVTCTWSTAHPLMHRAEAYHPGQFVVPLNHTDRSAQRALRGLRNLARRAG